MSLKYLILTWIAIKLGHPSQEPDNFSLDKPKFSPSTQNISHLRNARVRLISWWTHSNWTWSYLNVNHTMKIMRLE